MQEPDQGLVARIAKGDDTAFAAVYDRWGARLLAWLGMLLGNAEDAEDALQRVMLRLVRHRKKLSAVTHLRAYLFRMARNEAYRRRPAPSRPVETALQEVLVARPDAPSDLEPLLHAVGRLARERREVVALKAWHGLTFAEIGEVLDCSPNTASSRWRLALRDLAILLEETEDARR